MPKRKKIPKVADYTGIPKDSDKLVVQKSNPLQSLSETDMTLVEFKILDAYLSRVDSHDPSKRHVRFEKGELERILGLTKINKEDLKKRLKNLFQVVTIQDQNKKDGFTVIALFEKAEATQDEDGLWQADLVCTPSALEYIFSIENIGYLRYRLKNIIDLTSRYSYILYLYLENNRFRKSWTVEIEELKKILHCNAETYSQYKRFNDLILKKCRKELNEKTDLRFSYCPTDKRGRSYKALRFTLETVEEKMSETELIRLPENSRYKDDYYGYPSFFEDKNKSYGSEFADLLGQVACDDEFTPQQIRVIQDLVMKVAGSNALECCDYLLHKMHILDCHKVKNRYNYLISMLRNDIKTLESEL